MAAPLATTDDLADMWRPLAPDELPRVRSLIIKASALLRQVAPHIDERIDAFNTAQWNNTTDPTGLDPTVAATVVATIVKRFISNVEGVASQSIGPFSVSYALRTDNAVRGELQVTAADIKALRMLRPRSNIGSIRVHAALAPSPWAALGGAYANSAILATGMYDSEFENLGVSFDTAYEGPDGQGGGTL